MLKQTTHACYGVAPAPALSLDDPPTGPPEQRLMDVVTPHKAGHDALPTAPTPILVWMARSGHRTGMPVATSGAQLVAPTVLTEIHASTATQRVGVPPASALSHRACSMPVRRLSDSLNAG